MDLKNTLAAVSLSAAIIVLWGLFMQPSPEELKERQNEEIPGKGKNKIKLLYFVIYPIVKILLILLFF